MENGTELVTDQVEVKGKERVMVMQKLMVNGERERERKSNDEGAQDE